eukprot:TRINITY_DN2967_c0_g1_i2.p1 TRINITY_DN2967_c0_g1~~TRINITY_DN2967_c0_g1_i2.p1  ORF type:complete len:333 (-),score=66.43 TRINITY_DN2967_c0_g1_i2:142-1140(-)
MDALQKTSPFSGSSRIVENKVAIFCNDSSRYFADLIAENLGLTVGKVTTRNFGDGETYYRVDMNSRTDLVGYDAIFVSSTSTDADLLGLVRIGTLLAESGTHRRIFVIPFFGYSTMERAVLPGEVVTCKVNCRILSSIPNTGSGNVFLFLDLHVGGILQYFEGPCIRIELYAERVLRGAIERLKLENFVMASADLGRPQWVETFARLFGTDIALIRKKRVQENTKITHVIGEVEGKYVVIYDDMTRSAGTLIQAAHAYLEHGALGVYTIISHLALNNESIIQKIIDSPILKVISTNSHPMSVHPKIKESSKFEILDVSEIFSECICGYLRGF